MDQADPAAQQNTAPPQQPRKILLVEDDDYLADVYKIRLQAEGLNVTRVGNGEAALPMALQFQPELILLDIMMPGISGLEVLKLLRATPQTAKLKIVMVTALGQESDQKQASSLGADDYLVKSEVMIADVVERVKMHLGM